MADRPLKQTPYGSQRLEVTISPQKRRRAAAARAGTSISQVTLILPNPDEDQYITQLPWNLTECGDEHWPSSPTRTKNLHVAGHPSMTVIDCEHYSTHSFHNI